MFTLMVKCSITQSGIPVAFLLTRTPNATTVSNWLQKLKDFLLQKHNMDYNPRVVVMDMGFVEFNAVSEAFPAARIFYCAFHVLQAWNRKYTDENLGLLGLESEEKKKRKTMVSVSSPFNLIQT